MTQCWTGCRSRRRCSLCRSSCRSSLPYGAGDTGGVSWLWRRLTSVSNAGWIAYFALSRFWTALGPATSATVLAGSVAVLLARRRGVPFRPAAVKPPAGPLCSPSPGGRPAAPGLAPR